MYSVDILVMKYLITSMSTRIVCVTLYTKRSICLAYVAPLQKEGHFITIPPWLFLCLSHPCDPSKFSELLPLRLVCALGVHSVVQCFHLLSWHLVVIFRNDNFKIIVHCCSHALGKSTHGIISTSILSNSRSCRHQFRYSLRWGQSSRRNSPLPKRWWSKSCIGTCIRWLSILAWPTQGCSTVFILQYEKNKITIRVRFKGQMCVYNKKQWLFNRYFSWTTVSVILKTQIVEKKMNTKTLSLKNPFKLLFSSYYYLFHV